MGQFHYLALKTVVAQASNGDKFEFKGPTKWTASEYAPGPSTMTEEEVIELIKAIDAELDSLKC